jgi:hypothetical protein
LVRSMKNNFAPINRIPGAVLSLLPNHWEHQYMDANKDFVTLTHVCRRWREIFTSHPSFWTRLDFTNVDKTRAYIERSRSLPLEATICDTKAETSLEEALLLAIPHVRRFKSLTIVGTSDPLRNLTKHLTLPASFLKELIIEFNGTPAPSLDSKLFGGDLSSIRTLSLGGTITNLPWRKLYNLTTFKFRRAPESVITVTQLLNFLENAPQLTDITLHDGSTPTLSDACSSRVLPLPNLKNLTILRGPSGILLNHLSIPDGASLVLEFDLPGNRYPPSCYLPKTAKNLKNLFRVTTVNLYFDRYTKVVRLAGPSGGLYMRGHWERNGRTPTDFQFLRSLVYFSLHLTWSLTITKYGDVSSPNVYNSSSYRVLLRMKVLRTLTLIQCRDVAFIFALNPVYNSSKNVLCPGLKELVLYVEKWDASDIFRLMDMTRERALRSAKLRSITIVGLGEPLPGREVFQLKEHVEHVVYRVEEGPPNWDSIPGGESD